MKEKKNFEYKETDSDGQYNINFDKQPEENTGGEEVTHLNSEEDFSNLEEESPVEHEALMKKIEELEEKNKIDEMEKNALAEEEAEELEQKKVELREALNKAYESSTVDDRDDNTGQYQHFANLAREIKDEQITKENKESNKKINKSKNKEGRWHRGWASIQDRFNSK